MNKIQKLRQAKRYKNLSRYDIGKMPTNSGYQPGTRIDTGGFTSQRGEDIQPDIAEINSNILPNTLSQTANYGQNIYQMMNSMVPAASVKLASSLGTTLTPSTLTTTAGNLTTNAGITGAGINFSAQAPTLNTAGASSTTTTASNALSTAGTALGIAGALYGGYNMYKGFSDYGNYRKAGDMLNAMSKNTQSIEGVDVQTYGGLNSNAELDYVNAQNKAGFINNTLSGAGTGASIGSLIAPGIGTAIGGIIGGIGSAIGSIFGGKSRKRKVEEAIRNARDTATNYNRQAVSEAASQGLRNQFNLMHANCGKDRGMRKYNNGKITDYTKVWTPSGEQFGPVNSLVGKGESLIDYDNGKASYVNKGKRRVDNQPSIAAPGDNIVIAGNDIDMTNGISFADQAAPYSQMLQALNNKEAMINNSKMSDKTKELTMKQLNIAKNKLFSQLKPITDRQQVQHQQYNCGKSAKYDTGKIDFLSTAPYIAGMMAPISQYNYYRHMTPTADNSYVANPTSRQALQVLGSMRYDPYNQVQAVRDAYRQGVYNINQAGALTPGQRLAMLSAQNTGYARNLADVYSKADQINNDYKKTYAQALLESGEHSATRQQQALATQQENYRQAVAKKRLGIETAQAGMLNIGNMFAKNLFDQRNFAASQDYNNRIIDIYGAKNALDAIRLQNDINAKQDEIKALRDAKTRSKAYSNKYKPTTNAGLTNMYNPQLWNFATLQAPALYKYIR